MSSDRSEEFANGFSAGYQASLRDVGDFVNITERSLERTGHLDHKSITHACEVTRSFLKKMLKLHK